MGDRRHIVQGLGFLARLAIGRGDRERAGRLWGAMEAEEQRGPVGQRPRMAVWDEERAEYAAIVLADPGNDLEQAREDGRRLALADAVTLALSDDA
jgi:hypothetical protein